MKTGIALLTILLPAAGCGESEPALVLCEDICDFAADCSRGSGVCVQQCTNMNPGFSYVSDSFVDAFQDCLGEQSCQVNSDGLVMCVEARVEPNDETRAFCGNHIQYLSQCGTQQTVEECEKEYAWANQRLFDDVARCDRLDECDARTTCMQQIIDKLN